MTLPTPEEKQLLKKQATTLLRKYDIRRNELRLLEYDLTKACTAYGKATGRWGFNRDHLRMELDMEAAQSATKKGASK